MLRDLIERCRSYRRFDPGRKVSKEELERMVDNARLSASGANRQPLKFILSNEKEKNQLIFPTLSWAGYLSDWEGPETGERPTGYVVILGDRKISDNFFVDHGIAAWSILLTSVEMGLGGCMIASVDRDELRNLLNIDHRYDILLVVALGKPAEDIVVEAVSNGDIRYYRENDIHHVPKRSLNDLIVD